MLTIRDAQLAAFREPVLQAFVARLAGHLRGCFPDRTRHVGHAELHAQLSAHVREAMALGIDRQADLARYAELVILYQGRPAWAESILREVDVDGSVRMSRVDEAERAALMASRKVSS